MYAKNTALYSLLTTSSCKDMDVNLEKRKQDAVDTDVDTDVDNAVQAYAPKEDFALLSKEEALRFLSDYAYFHRYAA